VRVSVLATKQSKKKILPFCSFLMNKTSSVCDVMIHYIHCKCIVLPHTMQQDSSLWYGVTSANCRFKEVDEA
jgi:hypothetical protein